MTRPNTSREPTVSETKAVFEEGKDARKPLAVGEVAAALDCDTETANDALERLADDDVLASRLITAETEVWWLIDDSNGSVTAASHTAEPTSIIERARKINLAGGRSPETVKRKRLAEQRDQLQRIHRVNELLRTICRGMVQATTTEEIESTVCEQLVESEQYQFAVLGHFSLSYEKYTPHDWAGEGQAYLDAVLEAPEAPSLEQSAGARAARTGEIQIVQCPTDASHEYFEQAVREAGFQAYAAVPICHEKITYCVLGVYTNQSMVFDRGEVKLLAELGEIVGYGLHTIASMEDLRSEQMVELVFESRELASRYDDFGADTLYISVDSMIELDDESILLYLDVDGMSPNAFVDVVAGIPTTTAVRLLKTVGDSCRVEARASCTSIASALAQRDGRITEIVIEDGLVRIKGQIPRTSNIGDAIRTIEALAPDLELASQQVVLTPQLFRTIIEEQLTDCQQNTLELAYYAGYFEQPRSSDGTELATQLDVTPTTFHRHLRNAQSQLFERLFETGEWTNRE